MNEAAKRRAEAVAKRISNAFGDATSDLDTLHAAHAAHALARAEFLQNLTLEERIFRNVKRHYNADCS